MKMNFFQRDNKILNAETYFRRYLKIAPLSVALCRSVEAKHFSTIKMKPPVLDIGCGFGEFAEVFADQQIDTGVDNSAGDLHECAKRGKYKNLVLADARNLPFLNNTYSTIISISTMEHIKNVDKVFKEAYRVLKPNGIFVISVETSEVDKYLMCRSFLNKIGLSFLHTYLISIFNIIFHRHTVISKKDWEVKIKKAGFVIEESRSIMSPTIIKLFNIFIFTALVSQFLRPILNRRLVYRPQFIINLLTSLFLKYVDDKNTKGTVLFLIARKPIKK